MNERENTKYKWVPIHLKATEKKKRKKYGCEHEYL